jgi:NAD(P)-dependent dehydrogenase (short-subunit alcohol dehydrogenase family)
MASQIKGTVALVTGANRGIGLALVNALLERGAAKVYAAARRPETLAALAAESNGRVVPIRLDVTRPDQIRGAVEAAPDVSLLINNAGIVAQLGGEFADEAWVTAGREEYEVNVLGTLAVTQAFAATLAAQGGGTVANISSVAGLVALGMLTSYSASKAALHSVTQATRGWLKAQGTYVAGVYPGPIDTDMAKGIAWDKTAPSAAASSILDGLERGDEEIFPDPMAQELGRLFLRSPKELEQHMAAAS